MKKIDLIIRGLTSFIMLILISTLSMADGSKVPPPNGDQCVEDPSWMRTHHFETILHQRDETVIRGIRTTEHSLKNCIDCHITPNAEGEYARYSNDEEHFCASCHSFAAVSIDCFQCHSDRPEKAVREAIKRHQANGINPHHGMQKSVSDLIFNSNLQAVQAK